MIITLIHNLKYKFKIGYFAQTWELMYVVSSFFDLYLEVFLISIKLLTK